MQVRELKLDDFAAVKALNERNGLRTPDYAQWARLWVDNPHAGEFQDVPCGWVMEDPQANIVGAACNVPVMYDFGGRSIRTATGMAFVVDEAHRNATLLLMDAFFSQDRIDLLLSTTANPAGGKVWQAFQALRLPQADYDRNLMWITHYQRFARAVTLRIRHRGSRLLQFPLAGGLLAHDVVRRYKSLRRKALASERPVERIESFDCRFDTFWERLRNSGDGRLRAARDAQSLEWHFRPAIQREDLFILGCSSDEGTDIDGYLVARRNDRADIGLRRYQVADLQVRPGCTDVVPILVARALEVARKEKADVVELTGFESAKPYLSQAPPHRTRQLSTWPYFFKSFDPDLTESLRKPEAWDASPFDGDATL